MTTPKQSMNRLLAHLAPEDFGLIQPHLEDWSLEQGTMLVKEGDSPDFLYFPTSGIISAVSVSPEGEKAEAGIFGRESCAPISIVSRTRSSPFDSMIQVSGAGVRMPVEKAWDAMAECRAFEVVLIKALQNFSTQVAFTALSNGVHDVTERLARWLLMCHDRADGDEIPLTHGFISLMLGTRRSSVTTSLHVLEGNHFIHSVRGLITIRDREALEDFAKDAYGKPEQEYRRLFGDD